MASQSLNHRPNACSAMPAATVTLSESTGAAIGIVTLSSAAASAASVRPAPSAPTSGDDPTVPMRGETARSGFALAVRRQRRYRQPCERNMPSAPGHGSARSSRGAAALAPIEVRNCLAIQRIGGRRAERGCRWHRKAAAVLKRPPTLSDSRRLRARAARLRAPARNRSWQPAVAGARVQASSVKVEARDLLHRSRGCRRAPQRQRPRAARPVRSWRTASTGSIRS